MNDQSHPLVITAYTCPLCGKTQHNTGFYSKFFAQGIWWLLDQTPCCGVWLAWLPIEGVLIYAGSFRKEQDFVDWADAAGAVSFWLPVGGDWDSNTQSLKRDVDEIPF